MYVCHSILNVYICCKKYPLFNIILGNNARLSGNDSSVSATVDIKTDTCAAYEVITLSKQKVVMRENPAYEEIGRYYTITN